MNPRTIAVVGASRRMSRGTRVLQNLRTTGFGGRVWAINPRYEEVDGFPCYPTMAMVPDVVECVVVAIPAAGVPEVLEEAFAAGVRAAVVLSSGFGEGGHDESIRVSSIRSLATRGMKICGPNCYGIINVNTGAAAFSGRIADPIHKGSVGLVSQSGGFANVIADPLMEDRLVGFSYLVSCGNQLGLSVEDYLAYLVDDQSTQVIAAFVEGIRDPRKLGGVARRAALVGKPIVALMSGQSDAGKSAARSHTGSLAGSTDVMRALLRRYGIVQVASIDELIETVALFAVADIKRPVSRDLVVVTGSGGEGSHAADAAETVGLSMAPLSSHVKARIGRALPDFGEPSNPLDGTGTIFESADLFPTLFDAVLSDSSDGVVAVNLSARTPKESWAPMRDFAKAVAEAATGTARTVVTYGTSALGSDDRLLIATVQAAGVPYLAGTQHAMRAIASLYRYQQQRRDVLNEVAITAPREQMSCPAGVLPFLTSRTLLTSFGIPVASTELATCRDQATRIADRIGYPVAVKVEAEDLVHKSDIGGVVLGCTSEHAVAQAYDAVTQRARAAGYEEIAGVLVQAMPAPGTEVIAGVKVDPVFGPAVVFGLGGVFVELIRDVVTEIAPMSSEHARRMLDRVQGSAILDGARGATPVDTDALVKVLVSLANLAYTYRDRVISVDVNPIIVSDVGAVAVDAFIELHEGPS